MRVRRLIRLAHLYAGLALSLLLLVLAVTGSALVYKEAYWRTVYPELRGPDPVASPAAHASAIAAATARFGDGVRSVKMPEPGVPAYHLYLDDGEAFLSADDHRVIDRWTPRERLMPFLFDLHAHLMAGEGGERVGGIVGLLGVGLALTGLVLWWPARRRLRIGNLLPRELSRRTLIAWHRDLGALTTPLLLVLLLTGSGLVFYETARMLLNGMFGDVVAGPVEPPVAPELTEGLSTRPLDAAMMARVQGAFPGARVVFYYPPRGGVAVHRFRVKQPCELHPNGRTYVDLGLDGELQRTEDACAAPPGDRAANAMYPLHAGKADSGTYKLAVFIGGLALAILSLTGVLAYLKQLGATRRRGSGRSPRPSARREPEADRSRDRRRPAVMRRG